MYKGIGVVKKYQPKIKKSLFFKKIYLNKKFLKFSKKLKIIKKKKRLLMSFKISSINI
jgi:hypothetical protein